MLNFVTRTALIGCFVLLVATSAVFAQVVGGGSFQKPVTSQLGGLVDANIFKKLSGPPSARRTKPAASKTVPKATTSAKTVKGTKSTPKTKVETVTPTVTETDSRLTFDPVSNAGIDRELAATFSTKRSEQDALLEVFRVSKSAYDQEVAKKGRNNDIAMALTFFIATCVTVYHDSAEPTEPALDSLYETLAGLIVQENAIVNSSNIDKQILHDRLIYISGLVLGGYTAAKQQNDTASLATFRMLAGVCLKSLMQLEPDKLSFDSNGLVVKS